jgi:hypothetical protein
VRSLANRCIFSSLLPSALSASAAQRISAGTALKRALYRNGKMLRWRSLAKSGALSFAPLLLLMTPRGL